VGGKNPVLEPLHFFGFTPGAGRIELENFEITRTMSNFEQTPNRDAAKFLSDVGGMHTMPEQKRFRGRHRV
jgi:hypothetical protein